MPGPTPITSDFRLTFQYTADLLPHKSQHYLTCNPSGDASGYDTAPRSGFSPVGVSTLETEFFTRIAPFYDPTWCTFDTWTLDIRIGTIWNFVASGVTAVVPTGSGTFEKANQLCVSGKDLQSKNLPRYIYEGLFGTAAKINSPAAGSASFKALINYWYNTQGTATDISAYAWFSSRNNQIPVRWLAGVIDTNEKLRRIRNIK